MILTIDEVSKVYSSEESCILLLEKIRWNGIVISPFIPTSKVYKCRNHKYKCRDSGKYFNVKTNTVFQKTKIPLQLWFVAITHVLSARKNNTSVQLAIELNITQKTAWHILKRLKKNFNTDSNSECFVNHDFLEQMDVVLEKDRLQMIEWLKIFNR